MELFKQAKKSQDDPDLATAVAMGTTTTTMTTGGNAQNSSMYNMNVLDVLRKLPGITQHNYRQVVANVINLAALSKMNVSELEPLIGLSNAKKLHAFFNHEVN